MAVTLSILNMSSPLFRYVAKFILALTVVMLVSGCANNTTTKMPVDLKVVKKPRKSHYDVTLNVTEIVDKRLNKAIGIANGKSVNSLGDPMSWIKESLQNRGYRLAGDVQSFQQEQKAVCNLALELNILDFQTSHTSKAANVVLTLKNDTFPEGKIIRGQSIGGMWVGTDKEVAGAIRKSLKRAIDNLDDAVQDSCSTAS